MQPNRLKIQGWLKQTYWHICIIAAGLITLWVNILQYNRSGAQAFYGDDTFAHLQIVSNLQNGISHVSLGLPVLFQQSVVSLSKLFHADPVSTYTTLAILSYPLMVIILGYAAYCIFKQPLVGILTAIFIAFVSLQPLQTYQDGTIPNIYGIGVIFPLLLITLSQLKDRWRLIIFGFLATLVLCILFLTHHLSTLIAVSSLGLAGVFSSVWIAVAAPRGKRYLFFIPLLVLIGALLSIIYIIRPDAVFNLVQLYLLFSRSYPWISLVDTVGKKAPWNVIRYGQELGGIIFQLGVVGAFLTWFELRNTHQYREVFPRLVVTGWFIIYWVGSFTSASGEPDRLARDLALPGSMLAAYTIWWTTTHLQKKHFPLLIIILVVTGMSSVITGLKRADLALSAPNYLYGAIDQQVYEADASLDTKLGVFSPNYYWLAVADARGIHPKQLNTLAEIHTFLQNDGSCVLQFSYKEVIAGGIIDPRFAEPVLTGNTYTTQRFEDAKKVVWRFCQPSISPIANVSQNT